MWCSLDVITGTLNPMWIVLRCVLYLISVCVRVHICVCAYMCVCVCLCVCVLYSIPSYILFTTCLLLASFVAGLLLVLVYLVVV